jgi:D-glycero-alpha-D-manno-heptose-7-phosphate kinase
MSGARLLKIIHSRAPLRINDIGGWTDTWFSGEGKVLNVAVTPAVEVQVMVLSNPGRVEKRVEIHAESYGERFRFDPDRPSRDRHPLLQFAAAAIPMPKRFCLQVRIQSPVPAGISTGTSAAVAVALLGAVDLAAGGRRTAMQIASLAHLVETERLHQQSGIQDQICAARGGISFIHMSRYPRARVGRIGLASDVREELGRRLVLVYLGRPHRSSAIHEQVIALLEKGGSRYRELDRLRDLAEQARDRLQAGDLNGYGAVMVKNNECQRGLFSGLVSAEADEVIRLAIKWKASGWKVNGAGGQGGSLTLLAPADDERRQRLHREILALGRGIRPLPTALSPEGMRAWRSA